jgi:hypothetical protein
VKKRTLRKTDEQEQERKRQTEEKENRKEKKKEQKQRQSVTHRVELGVVGNKEAPSSILPPEHSLRRSRVVTLCFFLNAGEEKGTGYRLTLFHPQLSQNTALTR